MTRPIIVAALCAGLTAAAPAVAQTSVFNPRADTAASMQHYAKLVAHADCLMTAKQSATGVLTDKPNSKSERSKTAKLRASVKTCPTTGLENIHSLVRGTLAEAMYRRKFTAAPAAADPALAKAFVDGEKLFHGEREQGDQVMAAVIGCMVAASPQTAHALLSTTHGTPAEDSAMNALFAAGEKCGAGASRPANLSRSFVRAFVADSAWRYGQAVTR